MRGRCAQLILLLRSLLLQSIDQTRIVEIWTSNTDGKVRSVKCWREKMAIASVNPATGETLKTFKPLSTREIDEKLELANEAFREHRKMPYHERAQMLLKAGR